MVYLWVIVNFSMGGIVIDCIDDIYLENIWLMERVVKVIGLDIVGIDVVIFDISKFLWEINGVIVEVNVVLGFCMYVVFS